MTYFQKHRIFISRVGTLVFLFVLLFSGSDREGSLASDIMKVVGRALVGVAVVGRLWCLSYIAGYKKAVLNVLGPYSVSRNPLYFFSLIGLIGLTLATGIITFCLFSIALFSMFYPAVIAQEEQFLLSEFGHDFEHYCKKTPRFFPSLACYKEPHEWVINPVIFRRHLFDALGFFGVFSVFEIIDLFHKHHLLPIFLHLI